jgi:hypothetical protein
MFSTGAAIRKRNHIQICARDAGIIAGCFWVVL